MINEEIPKKLSKGIHKRIIKGVFKEIAEGMTNSKDGEMKKKNKKKLQKNAEKMTKNGKKKKWQGSLRVIVEWTIKGIAKQISGNVIGKIKETCTKNADII